jgi:hypothetical protein
MGTVGRLPSLRPPSHPAQGSWPGRSHLHRIALVFLVKHGDDPCLPLRDCTGSEGHERPDMAQNLDSIAPNERPIGFFCECGCMGFAEVTLDEFEAAGGAWLEGHKAELTA